jgi:phosphoglycerate dehydrogenase-like enzyme
VTATRIAVGPRQDAFALEAIRRGGGEPVEIGTPADALVWLTPADAAGVRAAVEASPGVRWVQLPWAGVEALAAADLFSDGRTWTCAKGSYAEPVAEHALTLALAGHRHLVQRARAHAWGEREGLSLFDEPVTILGGGGITTSLIELLRPFRSEITVVRRNPQPMPGVANVVSTESLADALPGALVVFLALALTPETTRIISAPQLEAMNARAWLVNVARGRHVDTEALVAALRAGEIAGAALDVTDPEPLPEGHALWEMENCLITPHSADTDEMVRYFLAQRIAQNVERFSAGQPLLGLIDPTAGY